VRYQLSAISCQQIAKAPTEVVFTPLNVPYSFSGTLITENSPPASTFGARLSNRSSRCDLSAVRLAAAIALASPTVPPQRRSVFDSSELSLSWLEQRLHLAAKTSESPHGKPDGDSLLHSSLVQVLGATSSRGIKNPEGRSGTSGRAAERLHVPGRRCLGSSMLPLSRLVDGVTVVNASLAQRTGHYTASATAGSTRHRSGRPPALWGGPAPPLVKATPAANPVAWGD
jgi:hypothetical protein